MLVAHTERLVLLLLCHCAFLPVAAGGAQEMPPERSRADTPILIGSEADQRVRTLQLLGRASTEGHLLRSLSSLLPGEEPARRFRFLSPEVTVSRNSAIPFSQNDGALWAGRGWNISAAAGMAATLGPVRVILAPRVIWAENDRFPLLPPDLHDGRDDYSAFASPWYVDSIFADLPLRFGDQPYTMLDPGQSSITLSLGAAEVGAATENQWWGPGIRNAIVLSNHAAGVPHLFARTGEPIRTRWGNIEGRLIAGVLTESLFFDTVSTNDTRSLSGFAMTFSPRAEPGLTIGLARTVYASASGPGGALARGLDVFARWEVRPFPEDTTWTPETQQLTSLFGRWVFPRSGFEAYAEWSRQELPLSIRDFAVAPHHSQGYTLGAQSVRPAGEGFLRLQGELTYLEPSTTFKHRPVAPYYSSRTVGQGYTHRGQSLGAAIGPGSSAQWLAADYLNDHWELGLYGNRVRWETDAFYRSRSPLFPWRTFRSFHARDVSAIVGVRAGFRVGGTHVGLEYGLENRVNYLFQNPDTGFGAEGAVDVVNHQLRLRLTTSRLPPLPR